jgi:hypothetical protein
MYEEYLFGYREEYLKNRKDKRDEIETDFQKFSDRNVPAHNTEMHRHVWIVVVSYLYQLRVIDIMISVIEGFSLP